MKRTPEIQRIYNSWRHIQQVVNNPNNSGYRAHQRQGVEIANDFETWAEFRDYVLNKLGTQPSPDHKLIRKDQSRNYGPKNIMWGLPEDVGYRFVKAQHIKYKGQTKTLNAWAREFDVHFNVLSAQLKRGKNAQQVFRRYG